ncbi:type I site-specific deoxyribonuclease [Kandleria vitulina DSM 20405]|jgi:type I restriction enzyme M protein|uniref:site-specific DNA-methyltransferase (adenine-specific) n=1 Tax=Kandleria vitulina DSM 20405 TaxID=1410657 RepID=A0A0R2HF43_9FIRM|nr:class I SAM-dependent DNA methyltransferase [Kandleria vitulina]KRN51240.1 type I site-specific deoxyribonuclease [Kandleria vitulina DSM 20405]
MITGELKNKIDGLWDVFAAGGLVNPLEVIEQITYLMFIRDLDDVDNKREKESAMLGLPYTSIFAEEVKIGDRSIDGKQLKWSVFHDFPAGRMYTVMQEWVFPFIKNLHSDKNSAYSKYMDDAIFKLPTPLLLSKVVDSLDEIYEIMNSIQSSDVRGDVYEYLLNKIASAGRNGQFRTPRHIIRMMVEMVDPKSDDVICDPACGTSGFLVSAAEYLKETKKEEIFFDKDKKEHYMNSMFNGFDMDRTMLRIGAMNMMTHGIDNPFIEYRDSLSDQNADHDKYSLILANPPFKGSLDANAVSADLLKVCKTKKTELLFLALFLRMLKVGGRCACIVPDGVLFGSSKAHKGIRKQIVEENRLEAVISMPSGVFKPYAGVSTAILIFTKTNHGGTDNVWFYDMTADGYSLDDKRTPVNESDIPDIIERFKNLDKEADRKRTDKSFMVPKQDIVDKDYNLSINQYKEIEYEKVEYPPTSEIMSNIREIEAEIGKEMDELERLLNL